MLVKNLASKLKLTLTMKMLKMFSLLCGWAVISIFADVTAATQTAAEPQSAYAKAVKSYIDAADREIQAMRQMIDAAVKEVSSDEQKKRFDSVYKKLERCEELTADLKKAGQSAFDKIKAEFERVRTDANQTFSAARRATSSR